MKTFTPPMVSVIIPAFNAAEYLDRCIQSVLNQAFTDFELIILDDGSLDNTAEVCNKWERTDQRIHTITKTNEGQGPSRDLGISMAAGKYLFFLDADDWIIPNCLERLVKTAEETMADIVIFDYYLTRKTETGDFVHQPAPRHLHLEKAGTTLKDHPELLSRCGGTVWNKLQRRDFILKNNIHHPCHRYEDISYVFQMLTCAERIVHLPELLYYYWINRADSTTNQAPYIAECFMALAEMHKIIGEYPHSNLCYSHLMKYSAAYLQIPLLRMKAADELEIKKVWVEYYRRYPIAEKIDQLKFIIIGSNRAKAIFQRMRFLNMACEHVSLAEVFPSQEARNALYNTLLSGSFDCLLIDFEQLVHIKPDRRQDWQRDCRLFAGTIREFWRLGYGVFLLEASPEFKSRNQTVQNTEQYFLSMLPEALVLPASQRSFETYDKADELRELLLKQFRGFGEK